jgi:O-antigen/teichoic acid export membrane protein
MFLITGAASLLVSVRKLYQFTMHLPSKQVIREKFRDTWKLSQWSLFGATSSWLQANVYLLLLFLMLGVTEVAYIAAARLLMTPIVLIITSWSNVMRPLLSKAMVHERPGRAETLMYQGMAASVAILLVYTLVLMAGLAVVPSGAFPEAYQGIQEYVLLWMLVFLFQLIRVNYSNYFQSALFFKMLAKSGMVVAVITVAMTAVTVQAFGEAGALIGLMLSELLFSIILLLKMKVDVPVVEKREE